MALTLLAAGAFPCASAAAGAGLTWSRPVQVDRVAPLESNAGIERVQCPSVHLCVANDVLGQVLTSTDPARAGSWRISWIPSQSVGEGSQILSCPSVNLCVLGGVYGNVFVSTDPAGGAPSWKTVALPTGAGPISTLSCPTAGLCLAIDDLGNVFSSTDPAAGPGAWQEHASAAHAGFLSCPTTSFCALVGSQDPNPIYTSTDPAGSAPWASRVIDPRGLLAGIACPSADLCVAFDGRKLLSSTAPTTASWKSVRLTNDSAFAGQVWCASPSKCVAAAYDSRQVFVSSNPTGGAGAWKRTDISDPALSDVVCPASDLCVASTQDGKLLASSDPAGGHWAVLFHDGYNPLTDVSCPGAHLCLSVDGAGDVLASRDPSLGPASWRAHRLDPAGFKGISCPATTLCVALDGGGRLMISGHPTGARPAWRWVGLRNTLTALDCPTVTRCWATDDAGHLWTTTQPLARPSHWKRSTVEVNPRDGEGVPLTGIDCVHAKLCVVGDSTGNVLVSTRPPQGRRAWRTFSLLGGDKDGAHWSVLCPGLSLCVISDGYRLWTSTDPTAGRWKQEAGGAYGSGEGIDLEGSTCATAHLCFGYGNDGSIYTSMNPAGGPSAWKQQSIDPGPFSYITGVACEPHSQVCVAVDSVGRILTTH